MLIGLFCQSTFMSQARGALCRSWGFAHIPTLVRPDGPPVRVA